jgi:lincosamide nucleotidyltransferase B/F
MIEPKDLLQRLEAVGASLANFRGAAALIGMGSVGLELERLDAWSDLDFFVIVENGEKQGFINDLDWLEAVHPVAFAFKNTPDGYKVLFADGIFCEFAVFEPQEIHAVAYSPGRVVWSRSQEFKQFAVPSLEPPLLELPSQDWLLGEALTNLLVGLLRLKRGEKLSAARFIQQYAVDRVVDLVPYFETEQPFRQDPFARERRFEQRFPALAGVLPDFIQGYERSAQSALAILEFLQDHFLVNAVLAAKIKQLAG